MIKLPVSSRLVVCESDERASNLDKYRHLPVETIKQLKKNLDKNNLAPKIYFNPVPPKREPACLVVLLKVLDLVISLLLNVDFQ